MIVVRHPLCRLCEKFAPAPYSQDGLCRVCDGGPFSNTALDSMSPASPPFVGQGGCRA